MLLSAKRTAVPLLLCSALAACAVEERTHLELGSDTPASSDEATTLTAELVVATRAGLGSCTAALGGTTAFVQAGSRLFSCARGTWVEQSCTVDRAGAVAFVTGETFLLACSAKAWARVALPSGAAGSSGRNSLVATSAEAAGANCTTGGLRVATGLDTNGNGTLDPTEATTSYVCNGASGSAGGSAAPLVVANSAASLAQCSTGGRVVQVYRDGNGNGVGDPGEEGGQPIILCNGDVLAANGSQPVARAFRGSNAIGVVAGEEFSAIGSETVLAAEITAAHAGTIIAFGKSLAYCDSTGSSGFGDCYDATPSTTAAWLTILPASGAQAGNAGEAVFQYLSPDVDNNVSAMATFEVSAPGTYTYNLVGMASDLDHEDPVGTDGPVASSVYFGVSELTLVFVPSN